MVVATNRVWPYTRATSLPSIQLHFVSILYLHYQTADNRCFCKISDVFTNKYTCRQAFSVLYCRKWKMVRYWWWSYCIPLEKNNISFISDGHFPSQISSTGYPRPFVYLLGHGPRNICCSCLPRNICCLDGKCTHFTGHFERNAWDIVVFVLVYFCLHHHHHHHHHVFADWWFHIIAMFDWFW